MLIKMTISGPTRFMIGDLSCILICFHYLGGRIPAGEYTANRSESMTQDIQSRAVPEALAGLRLDQALARMFPEYSRSRLKEWLLAGAITVDGASRRPRDAVTGGEQVEMVVQAEALVRDKPEPIALDIVFEDDDLLVINKPAGLVVHPGAGNPAGTLMNGLLHHAASLEEVPRAGIIHRIDKETSGLLLVAKSDTAFQSLAEQFASRTIRKFYTALVRGIPDPVEGSIEAPIGRHPVHRLRMTVRAEGRDARTDFQVIRQWEVASMVRLRIHTGRTHQIRVHMKHLDHPVLGDKLYGYKPPAKTGFPEVPRVMLHAARLELGHPVSGQPFKMEVPLPEDFSAVIDALDGDIRETESR